MNSEKIPLVYKIIFNRFVQYSDSDDKLPTRKARAIIGRDFRLGKKHVSRILHELYDMDLINNNHLKDIELLHLEFELYSL